MNTHKLFRLGKACVGLGALAAPAPLITCALDGRAGASALLPVVPLFAGIVLLAAHGTDAFRCDGCMTEVVNELAASADMLPIDLADEPTTYDLDEVA